MNVRAIDPAVSSLTSQAAATANPPAKKAAAPAAPQSTPAASVQMTQIPASVAADDRATYLQLLKANRGNAAAALAALQALEAKEQEG
jgi:hypothetical protein